MTSQIQVQFPKELALALHMEESELARELKRLSIIKLYELGKLSSGMAAKLLDCSRLEFFELVGAYQVSILGNPTVDQLSEDLEHT